MTDDFNNWWNDDVLVKDNPYEVDTCAFWAWEGWHAAVAAEREACAKLVDECVNIELLADAIRARG